MAASKPVYEPSEAEQGYVNKAVSRLSQASGFWAPTFARWRSLLNDYDLELDLALDDNGDDLYPYRSKVATPLARTAIDTMAPLVIGMVFDHDPPFTALPGAPGEDPAKVKITELNLSYQLRRRDFKGNAIRAIQQVLKIGHQTFRLRWASESKYITERQTVTEYGIPVGVAQRKRLVSSYEGPDPIKIPFDRFFPDPNTPPDEIQKARYVVEEDVLDWADFEKDAKQMGYANVEYLRSQVFPDDNSAPKGPASGSGAQQGQQDQRSLVSDSYAHDVKVIYYYDRTDVVFVATAPAGEVFLKRWKFYDKCPSGDYPYYVWYCQIHTHRGAEATSATKSNHHPGGFFPSGLLEPLHGLQQAHTTTMNQRIDNVTRSLEPPLVALDGALTNPQDLAKGWSPGRILYINDDYSDRPVGSYFQQIQFADMFGAGWERQVEHIEQLAKEASGRHDALTGQVDPRNTTATGQMQQTANAMKRVFLLVYVLSKQGIEPMLTAMSDMSAELIDPQTPIYDKLNQQMVLINPEDIVQGLAYSIRTVPPYAKALMSQEAEAALPILAQFAPQANATEMVRMFLENKEWLENLDKILPRTGQDLNFLGQPFGSPMPPPMLMPPGVGGGGGPRQSPPGQPPQLPQMTRQNNENPMASMEANRAMQIGKRLA